MAPGTRNKVDAPMFEPEVFWEKIYRSPPKNTGDIVGSSRRPPMTRRPGHCDPLVTPAQVQGLSDTIFQGVRRPTPYPSLKLVCCLYINRNMD